MLRSLACTSGVALMLTTSALAQREGQDAGDVTLYRVFVADHAEQRVTGFDLSDPDNRWTFETTGQAKLYRVDDGATVVAVQSDNDEVHFLNSGISLHSHGGHADIEIADPVAVEATLRGPRPFHVIDHEGKIVINFDRGGFAEIIDAYALSQGALETTRLNQARAHHGFVAPVGRDWVTTVASDAPVEGDAAPERVGLQQIDEDGTTVGDVATCTGIHGEAFSGEYLAAGCDEGVLTVRAGADGPVYQLVEYPEDLPAGESTGTLLGAKSMQAFLGNFGADGLVVIDPADEPHFRYIKLPFRRIDFVLDPVNVRHGYVLTEDGTLHQIDVLNANISNSTRITSPYSMDGHWNDPRPRLAMAGDEILVTDPNEGLVRRIAKDTLEEIEPIAVEGMPYSIVVVGGSGVAHDEDDEEERASSVGTDHRNVESENHSHD